MVSSPPLPAVVPLPPGLPPHELLLRQAFVSRGGRADTELAAGEEGADAARQGHVTPAVLAMPL